MDAIMGFAAKWGVEAVLGGIMLALTWGYKRLRDRQRKEQTASKAVQAGVRALLRREIIDVYNRYMGRGYCPIYTLEGVEDMYNAYKDLGGNGTITKLVEQLRSLPTEERGAS